MFGVGRTAARRVVQRLAAPRAGAKAFARQTRCMSGSVMASQASTGLKAATAVAVGTATAVVCA